MGKWLLDKVGVNGVRWICRGLSAAMLGIAGWEIYKTGKIDGLLEASDILKETHEVK